MVHRRHVRAVRCVPHFTLDDRGQSDELVAGHVEGVEPCIPFGAPPALELGHHLPHHFRGAGISEHCIPIGVEVALEGRRRDAETDPQTGIPSGREDAVGRNPELCLHGGGHLSEHEPLGYQQPAVGRPPRDQHREELPMGRAPGNMVGAGLDRAVPPRHGRVELEETGRADELSCREGLRNGGERRASGNRQLDHLGITWRLGLAPHRCQHGGGRQGSGGHGRRLSRKCCSSTVAASWSTSPFRPRVLPPRSRIAPSARAVVIRSSQ